MTKINTAFTCEDLTQFTNSLLFDDEQVACLKFTDEDIEVALVLKVTGDKRVSIAKDGEIDEDADAYRYADEYPEELREAIRNGEYDKDYVCEENNWFAIFITLSQNGELITRDDEVYEDVIHTKTPDALEAELTKYAEYLVGYYHKNNHI